VDTMAAHFATERDVIERGVKLSSKTGTTALTYARALKTT
jgi:hypothetical protein